jgi:integrase/recombinase XerD
MLDMDFSNATRKDIENVVEKINHMACNGKPCTEWTKYTYKVVLKRFYKWHKGENEIYPELVRWIRPRIEKRIDIDETKLLTHEDVLKMAATTNYSRDRAFLLFLYESGARIGEIMALHVSDFYVPDKYGAMMHIPKVKKHTVARDIRIMASAPAISQWLSEHPARDDPDAPLFCGIWRGKQGQSIDYSTLVKVIRIAAKRARIKKQVNPHFCRHSRATELGNKLYPAAFCTYMGWRQGSSEAATYIHKSNTDKEILKMHGIIKDEDKRESFVPQKCPRCGIAHDAAAKFCYGCSLDLDEKSIQGYDTTRAQDLTMQKKVEDLESMVNTLMQKFIVKTANDLVNVDATIDAIKSIKPKPGVKVTKN